MFIVLFCFVLFFIFQGDTSLFLFNLILIFIHNFSHNYDNYSMFRDVPECSMFLVLWMAVIGDFRSVFFL